MPDIALLVLSDAIVLTCTSFYDLVSFTSLMLRSCLLNGIYLRGGIAKGKHMQADTGPHHFVVAKL